MNEQKTYEVIKKRKGYAAEISLDCVTNDDSMGRLFYVPPVIVNYFYHSEIKKSARKGGAKNA